MKSGFYIAGLIASALLLSSACSSAADEAGQADYAGAYAGENGEDAAELPADFPRDLIPPQFTASYYTDMKHINGTESAGFESAEPVQRTIQHYLELLGEPTINVDSEGGERNVQWHSTQWPGWIVGVLGNPNETIVSVSKMPEQ